ncbi:ADP-ribosylglycohydrolase family protein, partial [Bacillus pseudomycoides]
MLSGKHNGKWKLKEPNAEVCAITRFKEAVLKAVNLGGDTDTVAAITGT